MVYQDTISVRTKGRGTYELTHHLADIIRKSGVRRGIVNVFVQHTSASLTICENADPDVLRDLEAFMRHLVPDGDPMFRHTAEGPDDMSAHVRSVLTDSGLNLPIDAGRCKLGTWQGVYLWEHRARPHRRQVMVTIYGE
jgi:secondary thiamine-phosphate synthase enzyme